jgi:hypothetical protein
VIKEVVCVLPDGTCAPFPDTASKGSPAHSATGVRVNGMCPKFCYRITIRNTGDAPLQNVVVTDDSVPDPDLDLDACNASLVGVTIATNGTHVCLIEGVEHCDPTRNAVTVRGSPSFGGGEDVTDTDTDNVTVLTASIRVSKQCSTVRNADGTVTVNYSGTVTNTGTADLANVTVQDDKGGGPIVIGALAAGASAPYNSSYNLPASTPCDTVLTDTVTARGTVADSAFCVALADRSVSDTATAECRTPPCPCLLVVTKQCLITPPTPLPFDCSGAKPLDSISLIWNGSQTIGIKAWKGAVGSTLLATIDNIVPGQKVTVTGYAGSPNDVYWELFATTTSGTKLGESTFHLSCSDVDMNGPEDCGKPEGDGKGKTGFINQWIFEGMAGNGRVLDCSSGTTTPTPSDNCVVPESPAQDCETLGKPTSLTFRYTGGGCAASNNPQSGKATCSGSINPNVAVFVRSANGYTISPTVVQPGESFTVSGGFDAQSGFTLSNNVAGGSTETLSIHTSCSQPLAAGDVFGSLTLVGFNSQSTDSPLIYRYSVLNDGQTTVSNVFLTDDRLGAIAGPFSLQPGETKMFDVPVQLFGAGSVTNIATATVEGQDCEASSGPVVVTVVPNCPVPVEQIVPFDCSGAKPIDSITMIWNGTQTIGIKAWKGAVGSTLLATIDNIVPGQKVTVAGYAGSPNDVYWELFATTTSGTKLGESTFHLSCSDVDMNGPEDCGKPEGDGKGRTGFINQWIFEGMAGNGRVLGCSTLSAGTTASVISKQLRWPLANTGSTTVRLTGLSLTWPASNGKLLKVKLDGDTVWDKQSAAGATSITLASGDLTSNTSRKSIAPGTTRVLILEFEKNASTTLSNYTLTVSFGSCVLRL